MKNRFLYSISLCIGILLGSCDKVEQVIQGPPFNAIDTSFYNGDFQYYLDSLSPVFEENTNTQRNALIEDFTGHRCAKCPKAAEEAHNIHLSEPNKVFIATIHAGTGGEGDYYQSINTTSEMYTREFKCSEGLKFASEFSSGFGFLGNPMGNVNRTPNSNNMFSLFSQWSSRANTIISDPNLKVNIQSYFDFYPENGGGYIHVESELLESSESEYNMVVYAILDSIVDWQKMPDNSDNPDYVHRDVLIGTADGAAFGQEVFAKGSQAGSKKRMVYSYEIPDEFAPENMHFLIYVYNRDTYEILQVIKQKLVE